MLIVCVCVSVCVGAPVIATPPSVYGTLTDPLTLSGVVSTPPVNRKRNKSTVCPIERYNSHC